MYVRSVSYCLENRNYSVWLNFCWKVNLFSGFFPNVQLGFNSQFQLRFILILVFFIPCNCNLRQDCLLYSSFSYTFLCRNTWIYVNRTLFLNCNILQVQAIHSVYIQSSQFQLKLQTHNITHNILSNFPVTSIEYQLNW